MNTKILQKCIDELKKETPTIQYVLGMLETLVEMQGVSAKSLVPGQIIQPMLTPSQPASEVSEAEMLDKLAAARLKEVSEMSTLEIVMQN